MTSTLPKSPVYVPYYELGDRPNIIVDGQAQQATKLTLSHWPWNITPKALHRDTSTEIVFAYLDNPEYHQQLPFVSNSHFDEDGLLSMYAVTQPEQALPYRDLMVATSRAGDFAIYSDPEAAKLSFVLAAYADTELSPLPESIFLANAREQVSGLYQHMLKILPALLENVDSSCEFWEPEFEHLLQSEAEIEVGLVDIQEIPEHDLAVIRIPQATPIRTVRRHLERWDRAVHPFAVHNRTTCSRLVWIQDRTIEFQYRYESWVQIVSHRPAPRIDMALLAEKLNVLDNSDSWIFEGINEVAARLYKPDREATTLDSEHFMTLLIEFLSTEPMAWDPYSPPEQ
jgi:hypothetical protein